MSGDTASARRLASLRRHLTGAPSHDATDCSEQQLATQPCAAAVRSLPQFDTMVMEAYMDDLRSLKVRAGWAEGFRRLGYWAQQMTSIASQTNTSTFAGHARVRAPQRNSRPARTNGQGSKRRLLPMASTQQVVRPATVAPVRAGCPKPQSPNPLHSPASPHPTPPPFPAAQVEVYELFRQHPELLDVVEEGMTKGEPHAAGGLLVAAASLLLHAHGTPGLWRASV